MITETAGLLAGLPVEQYLFPPNTSWSDWARANGCLPAAEEEEEEEREDDSYVRKAPLKDDREGQMSAEGTVDLDNTVLFRENKLK